MLWRTWVSLILGLWVALSPYALQGAARLYSDVISGLLIAAAAVWTLVAREHDARSPAQPKAA